MSQAAEIRAISAFGSPKAELASSAPPVVIANRAATPEREAFAATGVKLESLDVAALDLPRKRARRPFGLGAAASFLLHMALVLGALLWSPSQVERAPEPIAVEIVVERAPDPAPPVAPEPPVADAPQPVDASPPPRPVAETPPPTPEPIPSPVAETPPPTPEPIPPPVVETPPTPTPEPIPPPAVAEPPAPVAETPPPPTPDPIASPVAEATPHPTPVEKPVAKIEPPKPTPAPKRADRAPTPIKPKPTPRPAASRDAAAAASASSARAAASASSASVGEYRDAVYARIRARQHFPEAARDSGAHGTAELNFALDEAGQLRSVAIVKSSGEAALDADALATVRRSAPFGPPPPGAPRDYAVKLHYALQ